MKVIEEKIIVENGQEYKVKTYSNGTVVKEIVCAPATPKDPEPTEDEIYKAEVLLMLGEILAK